MQVQMIALEERERQLGQQAGADVARSAERLRAARNSLEGPLQIIGSTVRSEGIGGLWLGQTGTLLRETGGGIAWFLTFELVTRALVKRIQAAAPSDAKKLSKKDLASTQLMLAGGASGIMYNVVLFPADSVKSTMQTERELAGAGAKGAKPTGFTDTFRKIYSSKGIRGLYAGCGITCLRSAPSSALIL